MIWNIEHDALTLPRFEFLARFVARNTRTVQQRKLVGGYFVRETPSGYVYGLGKTPLADPTRDVQKLYENIRRTQLDHLTRMAEDFRAEAHLERERKNTQGTGSR